MTSLPTTSASIDKWIEDNNDYLDCLAVKLANDTTGMFYNPFGFFAKFGTIEFILNSEVKLRAKKYYQTITPPPVYVSDDARLTGIVW